MPSKKSNRNDETNKLKLDDFDTAEKSRKRLLEGLFGSSSDKDSDEDDEDSIGTSIFDEGSRKTANDDAGEDRKLMWDNDDDDGKDIGDTVIHSDDNDERPFLRVRVLRDAPLPPNETNEDDERITQIGNSSSSIATARNEDKNSFVSFEAQILQKYKDEPSSVRPILQLVFDKEVILSNEAFQKFIEKDPSVARHKYKFSGSYVAGIYTFYSYPLWGAVQLGVSHDVIQLLCDHLSLEEAIGNGTFESDGTAGMSGGLKGGPLHLACQLGASLDVIKVLSKWYPQSLAKKSSLMGSYAGYTPLHIACRHCAPIEVVQWLVEQCPEMLAERAWGKPRGLGYTPFHLACLHGAPLDVVRLLASKRPESLRELGYGDTALHLACRMPQKPLQCRTFDPIFNTNAQYELVEFLAKQNPIALQLQGYEDDTPLTAAQKQHVPGNLVHLLKELDKKLNAEAQTACSGPE